MEKQKIKFEPGQHGYDEFCCWECDVVFFDKPEYRYSICPTCNALVPNEWIDCPATVED